MDALGLAPPTHLSLEGNLAENWRRWRRNFENFLLAINSVAQPVGNDGAFPPGNVAIWIRQVAILRHCIGEDAVEILDQFIFDGEATPPEDRNKLPDVLRKFEEYFNPRRNMLFEWYVFWSLSQGENEPIDMFVKRLKTQAGMCEFGELKDMMILCRCVFGITNTRLREKLLQNRDVTLTNAIDQIRASEVTKSQLESISGNRAINTVSEAAKSTAPTPAPRKLKCRFCDYEHVKGRCPAWGKSCMKCGEKNHFKKVCPNKEVSIVDDKDKSSHGMNNLFIGMIGAPDYLDTWTKIYDVSRGSKDISKAINFKIDSGAQTNTLPVSIARQLDAQICPSDANLLSYSKHKIPNYGKTALQLATKTTAGQNVSFELVPDDCVPVLGLTSSVKLGIIQRIDVLTTESIIDEFKECFDGIGKLDREHEIRLDPDIKTVVNRPRRVPLSMTDKVKAELERMESMEVIRRVDTPTEWVNSMVAAEKRDGSVRICLDPQSLNKAILREHHHIPTLEDISHKFAGMKKFTIMDMKHAYWHIPLTEKSQLLTTFSTPFGRYCFLRLPFGLNSAAEVFEKRVEEIFGDLNVAIYFDDLIVYGEDQHQHDINLRKLLVRAKENNVKFNKDKMQLNCSEVRYLGHIVSSEGLRPDPSKVQAINEMPDPQDKLGIQRLLGSLNYLRGFIPDVSEITEPLRHLMKEEAVWDWGDEQRTAIAKIKKLLTSEPLLKYFDVKLDTTLQVDASKSGLGAVLMQDGHPVAYASRALTETEQNWPQIDKELLAIVYGFEKFHSYVYGRPIDVQTDHNPLVTIIKKELYKASPRLQKLLLRLMNYHVNKVTYVPGKYLYLADTLSRAYIGNESGEMEEEIIMVHTVQIRPDKRDALEQAYEDDNCMAALKDAILNGWTWSTKRQAPALLQPYWSYKDELFLDDGFIYRGEQLVVPAGLRREYLSVLHKGHLGIDKCTERARQCMFWPGMTTEIREMASRCHICLKHSNQQQKEPLIPHEVPQLPWCKVGMDIMEFQNKNYLVVVDFYSHYPELRVMQQKRGEDVVAALKSIFAVHGVPLEVIADNMPFNSMVVTNFAKDWNFTVTTSSPHYHKANGMAERYVQTIKQFLRKASDTGGDVYEALLAYRQTPLTGLPYSPAEMLFNRCLRGILPSTSGQLEPAIPEAYRSLKARQDMQKMKHDRHAKPLRPLDDGTNVMVRISKEAQWTPGQIVGQHNQPRSYIVDNGTSLVRRNRVHLRPSPPESSIDEETAQDTPVPEHQPEAMPRTPINNTPRRSRRENLGTLPQKYQNFVMN